MLYSLEKEREKYGVEASDQRNLYLAAMEEVSVYSVETLGKGENGGFADHQQARLEIVAALARGGRIVARADEAGELINTIWVRRWLRLMERSGRNCVRSWSQRCSTSPARDEATRCLCSCTTRLSACSQILLHYSSLELAIRMLRDGGEGRGSHSRACGDGCAFLNRGGGVRWMHES